MDDLKLAVSPESVTALRTFAEAMPRAMNNAQSAGDRLMRLFLSLEEELGPHADKIYEMIENIRRARELAEESITELSCSLKCAADRMESYITQLSCTGTAMLAVPRDIRTRFAHSAMDRLAQPGTNADAAALYKQYESLIVIADYDYEDIPVYNILTRKIYLNAYLDLHNPNGNMSYYFHEVGHMIDDHAGNGHTWLSSDPEYRRLIEEDFRAYVHMTMTKYHCSESEAFDYISEEISNELCSNISDIFGSLSRCRCQGFWGHSESYWDEKAERVEQEAFANMFESSVGSEDKVMVMRRYLPNAYRYFEYLLRSAI